jgi:hypothetical protein
MTHRITTGADMATATAHRTPGISQEKRPARSANGSDTAANAIMALLKPSPTPNKTPMPNTPTISDTTVNAMAPTIFMFFFLSGQIPASTVYLHTFHDSRNIGESVDCMYTRSARPITMKITPEVVVRLSHVGLRCGLRFR